LINDLKIILRRERVERKIEREREREREREIVIGFYYFPVLV